MQFSNVMICISATMRHADGVIGKAKIRIDTPKIQDEIFLSKQTFLKSLFTSLFTCESSPKEICGITLLFKW